MPVCSRRGLTLAVTFRLLTTVFCWQTTTVKESTLRDYLSDGWGLYPLGLFLLCVASQSQQVSLSLGSGLSALLLLPFLAPEEPSGIFCGPSFLGGFRAIRITADKIVVDVVSLSLMTF